jgi:hypothetical protein
VDDGSSNGLVTVTQAAEALQIHPRSLRKWVASGRVAVYERTLNGGYLLSMEEVATFASTRRAPPLTGAAEFEAAMALIRDVAARLASVDPEREALEHQRARLRREEQRLAAEVAQHRRAKQAYEERRRELSLALAAAGTGTQRFDGRRQGSHRP